MNTTITVADPGMFRDAVTWATSVISGRPANLWYTVARLGWDGDGWLSLAGFDGDIAVQTTIPATGTGDTGTFYVAGVLLGQIAKLLAKGTVTLTVDDTMLHVRSASALWKVRLFPDDDHVPDLPEAPPLSGTVTAGALRTAIEAVRPAVSTDDTLIPLLSIRVTVGDGTAELVASDRYRLAFSETSCANSPGAGAAVILLPGRVADLVARHADGEVRMFIGEGQAGFEFDGRKITGRLGGGQFPDANTLRGKLSPAVVTASVPSGELVEAVQRVALVLEKSEPVVLEFEGETVTLTGGEKADTAAETIEAKLTDNTGEGDPHMRIAVNPVFLAQSIAAAREGRVNIAMSGPHSPLVITGSDPAGTYCCVLMPLRVPEVNKARTRAAA